MILDDVQRLQLSNGSSFTYTGGFLSGSDGSILAQDIKQLMLFDGFRFYIFNDDKKNEINGPGSLYIDTTGVALFSNSQELNSGINKATAGPLIPEADELPPPEPTLIPSVALFSTETIETIVTTTSPTPQPVSTPVGIEETDEPVITNEPMITVETDITEPVTTEETEEPAIVEETDEPVSTEEPEGTEEPDTVEVTEDSDGSKVTEEPIGTEEPDESEDQSCSCVCEPRHSSTKRRSRTRSMSMPSNQTRSRFPKSKTRHDHTHHGHHHHDHTHCHGHHRHHRHCHRNGHHHRHDHSHCHGHHCHHRHHCSHHHQHDHSHCHRHHHHHRHSKDVSKTKCCCEYSMSESSRSATTKRHDRLKSKTRIRPKS